MINAHFHLSITDSSPGGTKPEFDRSQKIGIPREVIPAMRKAFSNLCTSPSGVLFENAILQVGVKHEYSGSQGRISIFFGNMSKTPLTNVRAVIDEVDHLRVQKTGTQGLLDEDENGGCTVAVRTQARLLLMVEVAAPFDDAPAMRVCFTTREGEVHEYPLRLPIVATCFMEPVTLEPEAFMHRWKSLEGQDRECQEVIKTPPDAPRIDEEYMKRIVKIVTEGLKFGRCEGCDTTPWTVSGASTFRTGAKDLKGNNINVGCLVRVEANPTHGAFRITTRTLHPLCSKAVKNVALVSIKLA
jgi:AP-2 complex subunit alpha